MGKTLSANGSETRGFGRVYFRQAREEDFPTVFQLVKVLGYNPEPQQLREVLRTALAQEGLRCVFAVVSDDLVVGMITLRSFPVIRLGGIQVSIEELVVLPEWRGRGVGASLVNLALSWARAVGAARIEVLSSRERESVQRRFYEKMGFQAADSQVYRVDLAARSAEPLSPES